MWHETTAGRPCIRCHASRKELFSLSCAMNWNVAGMLSARKEFRMVMDSVSRMEGAFYRQVKPGDMLKAGRFVSQLSIQPVTSFLKSLKDAQGLFVNDAYPVLLFSPVHSRHLGTSKILKNSFKGYGGYRSSRTKGRRRVSACRISLSLKGGVLCAHNSMLASIERAFPVSVLRADLSEEDLH